MHAVTGLGQGLFDFVYSEGKWGLGLILAIEEAGIPFPIPGDLLLSFAGSHIASGRFAFWPTLLFSVIGVSLGASFLYLVFKVGGRPFVLKYGKYILLPPSKVKKLEHWFNTKGRTAILIGRFVPGLRVFLSGIAGLLNLNYWYFLIQVIIASALWAGLFLGIGYYLGNAWSGFTAAAQKFGVVFFVIFIAVIIHFIWKNRSSTSDSV